MPQLVLDHHFKNLESFLTIPLPASGLIVYTQDKRIIRKLAEEGQWLEQEIIVGVEGQIVKMVWKFSEGHIPSVARCAMPPAM